MVSFSFSVVGKTASAMNEHHGQRFPNEGLKTREGMTMMPSNGE